MRYAEKFPVAQSATQVCISAASKVQKYDPRSLGKETVTFRVPSMMCDVPLSSSRGYVYIISYRRSQCAQPFDNMLPIQGHQQKKSGKFTDVDGKGETEQRIGMLTIFRESTVARLLRITCLNYQDAVRAICDAPLHLSLVKTCRTSMTAELKYELA